MRPKKKKNSEKTLGKNETKKKKEKKKLTISRPEEKAELKI